ncbi:MAG: hypothetical protein OEZ04_11850 [Nitrospinota bacterium]|nr:hypothetical protein [Nitrospinota bacterium]
MASVECVVCAWRATCSLKYRYESSELHCREFTKDVIFQEREDGKSGDDPDTDPSSVKDKDKAE